MKRTIGLAIIIIGIAYAPSVQAEIGRMGVLRDVRLQNTLTLTPSKVPAFGILYERKDNIIDVLKNKVKGMFGLRFTGVINSLSDSLLVVTSKEGKTWNVHLTDKTQIKRRFGGESTLSEFAPNDEVAIVGRRQQTASSEPSETDMDAKNIRNLSIQKRKTVFIGDIITVKPEDASFTIETKNRGVQTVYKTKDTEVTEKNIIISFENLSVGDRVVVKGELWDRANDKINAKKIMRLSIMPAISSTNKP